MFKILKRVRKMFAQKIVKRVLNVDLELNIRFMSPRAFYYTKMCEKSKPTTFSYYKKIILK